MYFCVFLHRANESLFSPLAVATNFDNSTHYRALDVDS